jgi:putative ABC transport system substrate-binding protein
MRRRDFIATIGGAAAWPLMARAQQRDRLRRIGILAGSDPIQGLGTDAFKQALADLGWNEGRNIRFEEPRTDTDEQLTLRAAQLARLAPDAIFVDGSPPLQAMRRATSDIPIVFANVGDPVGQGFVSSLARPAATLPASPPSANSAWSANSSTCSRN